MTAEVGTLRGAEADAAREQAYAAQLITTCNSSLRVLRLHDTANEAVMKPIESLRQALDMLRDRHPRIALALVEGVFYLGEGRVRLGGQTQAIADQLAQELVRRGVGGFTFDGTRTATELVTFFRVLDKQRDTSDVEALRKAVRDAGITGITVAKVLRPITEAQKGKTVRGHAADLYAAAIRHVADSSASGATGSVRAKRIVHELIDLADKDPLLLLALAGLRGTGSDEAEHVVAVTALAVALGQRIALDRVALADLGMCALQHDMGLASLGDGRARDVDRHPIMALKALLDVSSLGETLLRQVVCAFEHHRDFAGGGRPAVSGAPAQHPFSMIVRITNDFDGLTRGRRGRAPLDVADALVELKKGAGKQYHAGLILLFVEMVGGVEAEIPASGPISMDPPAPSSLPPSKYGEIDWLLADFVGKANVVEDEVVREASAKKQRQSEKADAAHAKKVAARATKTALGSLKLKKIGKKKR